MLLVTTYFCASVMYMLDAAYATHGKTCRSARGPSRQCFSRALLRARLQILRFRCSHGKGNGASALASADDNR